MNKLIKIIIIKLHNRKKKNTKSKNKRKQMMIETFGKKKYYLSFWFGEWVLYL
jgi:hypothetical protein